MSIATIIMAAGLGTRMKSEKAKVLHELCGKPLVCYPVELSLALKCERVAVVVGHQAEQVKSVLASRYDSRVRTALQKEQLGTGHAVLSAQPALRGFHGQVLILSGDVPLLTEKTVRALMAKVKRTKSVLGFISSIMPDPTGYGRVLRDEKGRILSIVEQRDATKEQLAIPEGSMGIYLVDADFLFKGLKKIGTDNDQGEYYLPDLIRIAVEAGHSVTALDAPVEQCLGINNRSQLAKLQRILNKQTLEKLMLSGVTVLDPEYTWIDADVKIGTDTVIYPGCRLQGKIRIGKNCIIETGSVIRDSELADDIRVQPYSVIEESHIDGDAQIGPFAHLRPFSRIGVGCHVGNFVETKKSVLMPGVKANHLSYLGDATIGRNTNIGAGTITCNYDGYNKYKTVIGEEVLVGSDTQLIAPVTVPDRVVLGAGTSLTAHEQIPAGALVVMRPQARIVEGFRDKLEARSKKSQRKTAKKTNEKKA